MGFTAAAGIVHELMEAMDWRRLLNLQRQLSRLSPLLIDELGFVPLSRTGAELLFEVFSQRCVRGSILATTDLLSDEWTWVCGPERLAGDLLDRLIHYVHIVEMNSEGCGLKCSRQKAAEEGADKPDAAHIHTTAGLSSPARVVRDVAGLDASIGQGREKHGG